MTLAHHAEPPALPIVSPPAPLAPAMAALPPWCQRADEPLDAWILFLRWTFGTRPRPRIENEAVRLMALRYDWDRRAAVIDHRLAPARPLAEVTQNIALDAVSILSTELEALAAECRANPGRQRLKDLTPLLGLISDMGGFGAVKPASDGGDADVDYSQLSEADLATLAAASGIMARARKVKP